MKKVPLLVFIFLTLHNSFAQTDPIGSGRAILFDGVDDYIDLGNIYDDLALPITISAWVYVEPESDVIQYPIFDSQDNSSSYNGFTFVCSTLPHIGFTIGDGQGGNNAAFRRSRAGYFQELGKWVYMTSVARSGYDIHNYLNGHEVNGEYQGTSSSPMNSYSPTEVAKIGYLFSNGLLFRFKGIMDEVRIWNRALTEQEIRQSMCKRLTGSEPGLIGYWNFDETGGDMVLDGSPNGFNGSLKGNPQRVFSGAPVGNESTFLYTSSWAGAELSHKDMLVSNIQGNPFGVHIYSVNSSPSQTGGLDPGASPSSYYGVFLADDSGNNTFDFSFTNADAGCDLFERPDNSVPDWNPSLTFTGILRRIEVIPSLGQEDLQISLGPDVRLCDRSSYLLQTNTASAGRTFSWNTGERTADITVTASGQYAVQVTERCKIDRDTINVSFLESPPDFSLGKDEELCHMTARTLSVNIDPAQYQLQWQDATRGNMLVAKEFGTYWLKVSNECGVSSDSVTFTKKVAPDFTVNLGPDMTVCDETSLLLKPLDEPQGKSFYWSNGERTSTISVTSPGRYIVDVTGECTTKSDTIFVSFAQTPPTVSLGDDDELCAFEPRILAVDLESNEYEVTWQDGSSEDYFLASDFGTYWVKVASICGVAYDSITFTEKKRVELSDQYNFISPDNVDDDNQYLILQDIPGSLHLTVFNRWGKEVFRSANYDNRWDGGNLPSGIYFYTIQGECFEPYKGTLTIMR